MTFHFENPKALFALFTLIPAIIVGVIQYIKFKNAITSFNNISKMHIIRRLISRMICYTLAFASIIIALADPYWGVKPVAVQTRGAAISYVFDISYSMNADDAGKNHDITRLEAASLYAKALTERLQGCAISVVLAKGEGFTAIPLTEDLYAVENLLENLSPKLISSPGTNLANGITTAIKSFPTQSSRQSTIILFTDGDETEGKIEQAMIEAASYGIKLIVLGFGSEQGAQIVSGDGVTTVYTTLKSKELKETINKVHNKTIKNFTSSAEYFSATDTGSLSKILSIVQTENVDELGMAYEMQPIPRYRFFILLAFILIIIGVLFAELNIRFPKTIIQGFGIFLAISLFFGCSADFSSTKKILHSTLNWYKKDYQEATAGFLKVTEEAKDSENQELLQYGLFGLASSYIMQEEETAALEKLELISGDAPNNIRFATYYNTGIIAHKHGDYKKAQEAFKQALLIDSTNIDAKINYELSLMKITANSSAGKQELTPISKSEDDSSIENTLFSVIRENEKNRWKNTETQQENQDILDY